MPQLIAVVAALMFAVAAGASETGAPAGCPNRVDRRLERDLNFGIVRPARILRSRRPTKALLKYLRSAYGLGAIVDLRNPEYKDEGRHMAEERALAESLGIRWIASTVNSLLPLAQRDATLRAAGESRGPVLIHCHGGKDRTGAVTALLRLLEGWSYAEAAEEMRAFGHDPDKDRELHAALRRTFAEAGSRVDDIRPGWRERLSRPLRCP
ncbi:MAG: tyrosine-protein phosphatase [Elusimicrobia bacterium]|nr:tyrosine-protein phosphatase [Elusimicrobiota bacterium]